MVANACLFVLRSVLTHESGVLANQPQILPDEPRYPLGILSCTAVPLTPPVLMAISKLTFACLMCFLCSVLADQPSLLAYQPSILSHQPRILTHQPGLLADQPGLLSHQPR